MYFLISFVELVDDCDQMPSLNGECDNNHFCCFLFLTPLMIRILFMFSVSNLYAQANISERLQSIHVLQ